MNNGQFPPKACSTANFIKKTKSKQVSQLIAEVFERKQWHNAIQNGYPKLQQQVSDTSKTTEL
jgi:hypothetical protein